MTTSQEYIISVRISHTKKRKTCQHLLPNIVLTLHVLDICWCLKEIPLFFVPYLYFTFWYFLTKTQLAADCYYTLNFIHLPKSVRNLKKKRTHCKHPRHWNIFTINLEAVCVCVYLPYFCCCCLLNYMQNIRKFSFYSHMEFIVISLQNVSSFLNITVFTYRLSALFIWYFVKWIGKMHEWVNDFFFCEIMSRIFNWRR